MHKIINTDNSTYISTILIENNINTYVNNTTIGYLFESLAVDTTSTTVLELKLFTTKLKKVIISACWSLRNFH